MVRKEMMFKEFRSHRKEGGTLWGSCKEGEVSSSSISHREMLRKNRGRWGEDGRGGKGIEIHHGGGREGALDSAGERKETKDSRSYSAKRKSKGQKSSAS